MLTVNKTYNVLVVLLEYIDLLNPSDNINFEKGCPVLYYSILLCYILSMASAVVATISVLCSSLLLLSMCQLFAQKIMHP